MHDTSHSLTSSLFVPRALASPIPLAQLLLSLTLCQPTHTDASAMPDTVRGPVSRPWDLSC